MYVTLVVMCRHALQEDGGGVHRRERFANSSVQPVQFSPGSNYILMANLVKG